MFLWAALILLLMWFIGVVTSITFDGLINVLLLMSITAVMMNVIEGHRIS